MNKNKKKNKNKKTKMNKNSSKMEMTLKFVCLWLVGPGQRWFTLWDSQVGKADSQHDGACQNPGNRPEGREGGRSPGSPALFLWGGANQGSGPTEEYPTTRTRSTNWYEISNETSSIPCFFLLKFNLEKSLTNFMSNSVNISILKHLKNF